MKKTIFNNKSFQIICKIVIFLRNLYMKILLNRLERDNKIKYYERENQKIKQKTRLLS